jgi:hypothetical protein
MSNLEQSLDDLVAQAKRTGRREEFLRLFELLTSKEALRPSFFLDGWVLYTQNEPIDISMAELKGEDD